MLCGFSNCQPQKANGPALVRTPGRHVWALGPWTRSYPPPDFLGVVTLPIDEPLIRVEPLGDERMVAILPADMKGVPDVVTPAYVAGQQLILEPGAIQHLVLHWLSQAVPTPKATMVIGTVEALKAVVAAGLGISIVPEMAITGIEKGLVVRPLDPPTRRRRL